MKNRIRSGTKILSAILAVVWCVYTLSSCSHYSFGGISTDAKTFSLIEFYNNTDLAPANIGQNFTNSLKNYLIQNSSLSPVSENGELQYEGEITDFKLNPIAPVASNDPALQGTASSTRFTIVVKVSYTNTRDETMSFKDKSFSFYKDFSNDENFTDVQENLTREIFDQLMLDIFNASVANW